jgi:hypothetical protein
MLRGLLSAGAMIGPLKAEIAARTRHVAVLAAAAVVCLLFVTVGLLALALAAIAVLEPLVGLAVAAAITGGAAILIGLIVLLIASSTGTARRPSRRAAATASDATAQLQKSVAASPLTWLLGAALVGLILGRRI